MSWSIVNKVRFNSECHFPPPSVEYTPGDILRCDDCGEEIILDFVYGSYQWRRVTVTDG